MDPYKKRHTIYRVIHVNKGGMKYMDNLSEKIASVVVRYTDLDNNLAELSTSGNLT